MRFLADIFNVFILLVFDVVVGFFVVAFDVGKAWVGKEQERGRLEVAVVVVAVAVVVVFIFTVVVVVVVARSRCVGVALAIIGGVLLWQKTLISLEQNKILLRRTLAVTKALLY